MSSVPEMFDRISPQYDRVNRILSLGRDMHWRRSLARHFPKRPCALLDLATGTGDQIAALLSAQAPIQTATGIDLSQGMLAIAKKKLPAISFLQANAEQLPFPTQSFDICTFSFGIRNVSDPLKALSEMRRVLKPGGRCLILEFSLPQNLFRWPYLLYLRHILPPLGGLLARDPPAYRYLNKTIEAFPSGERFLDWMRQTGWGSPVAFPLLFGSVTLYRGDLP